MAFTEITEVNEDDIRSMLDSNTVAVFICYELDEQGKLVKSISKHSHARVFRPDPEEKEELNKFMDGVFNDF